MVRSSLILEITKCFFLTDFLTYVKHIFNGGEKLMWAALSFLANFHFLSEIVPGSDALSCCTKTSYIFSYIHIQLLWSNKLKLYFLMSKLNTEVIITFWQRTE